jgi:hypothetical protein
MVISTLRVLTINVPLWVCLILVVFSVYLLNRPIPERTETEIVYRDYWRPPIINRTLPPSRLVHYMSVPTGELRVDTIYVPVDMRTYQLWQPDKVHRRSNSIVVRSFNPSDISYRDYEYKPLEPKFRANIEGYALYPMRVGLDATIWRSNLGLFGRVENGDVPYYGVGIKYRFY